MLNTAQEVIASGDTASVVDFGIELDRRTKEGLAELEKIKTYLRSLGETSVADRRTEKTVELVGQLGTVCITYPADEPKLKAGVDLLASEEGIPREVFKLLFRKRTIVEFADGFVAKLAKLAEEDREMILNLLKIGHRTARVQWPK